jgi:hypothetical protein
MKFLHQCVARMSVDSLMLQLFQYELSFLIREIAPPLFTFVLLSKHNVAP